MTVTPGGQRRMLSDEDRRTLGRIEEDAGGLAWKFNQFRWQQTMFDDDSHVTAEHKAELREQLGKLADELDRLLSAEYGINPRRARAFDAWRASHQPFHCSSSSTGSCPRAALT